MKIEAKIDDIIGGYAFDVVKEWDWPMEAWNPSVEDFDDYKCRCLDIGHENRLEICEIIKERLAKDGHISHNENKYDEHIDECAWDYIVSAIIRSSAKANNTTLFF